MPGEPWGEAALALPEFADAPGIVEHGRDLRPIADDRGVGEETGELEHTLGVISDYYDNESDTATARAISLLEPILIVILAIFVLLVLLAVYIPIFGMYDSVGAS